MHQTDVIEPGKWVSAIQATLIMAVFFSVVFFSSGFSLATSSPPPLRVSLVPNIAATIPPPPDPPSETEAVAESEVLPEPEPPVAKPSAAEKIAADIVRQREEREKAQQREQEAAARVAAEEEAKRRVREEAAARVAEEEAKRQEALKQAEEKARRREKMRKKAEEAVRRQTEKSQQESARKAAETASQLKAELARQAALDQRLERIGDRLAGLIKARINDYLKTPQGVPADCSVVVVLSVKLSPSGELRQQPQIIESSGYPEYDDSAIKAVMRAAPLPMPRDTFIVDNETLMADFLAHRLSIYPYNGC